MRWALVALVLCLLGPRVAHACSCVLTEPRSDADFQARVDAAAVVFEGDWRGTRWDGDALMNTFEVVRTFKGPQGKTLSLESGTRRTRDSAGGMTLTSGGCDSVFDSGPTYLVFAYADASGSLFSSMCSPTRPSREAGRWFAFLEGERDDSGPTPIEPAAGCTVAPRAPAPFILLGVVALLWVRPRDRVRRIR